MFRKNAIAVHVCCAPDATFSLFLLDRGYQARGFFYNPCIHPVEEYEKRAKEMEKLEKAYGINWEEGKYNPAKWFRMVKGLENEPEKGRRCELCIYERLKETAIFAKKINAPFFTTVLTNSPRKDITQVFHVGETVARETGVQFLPVNFKKHGWYKKSLEITVRLNIYRQNYCGCIFSMARLYERRKQG